MTIEINDITFSYVSPGEDPDRVTLLDHISLNIPSGEFVLLRGGNRSGKSTLARMLNGLLLPTSGVILVDGINTRDPDWRWEIRRRVGIIFQEPENQILGTTVAEDVAFGPENLGLAAAIIRERVLDALQTVGMSDYADVSPHLLSRSQQLKVSLAAILAMQPSCIVLDEATAGLEPADAIEIMLLLQRLNRETGVTVFIIAHETEERITADTTILLKNGRLVRTGMTLRNETSC